MRKRLSGALLSLIIVVFLCRIVNAAALPGVLTAPPNPDFVEYRKSIAGESSARGMSGQYRGYIPFPVDLTHLRSADYSGYLATPGRRREVPAQYDLRNVGGASYVTSVKNQAPYDNCWAFSALGSMESAYLREKGTRLDLSEMHLSYYTYRDTVGFSSSTSDVLQNGGNNFMSTATLARWVGSVLETTAPYSHVPSGAASSYANRLHLQHAYYLNIDSGYRPSNDIRKELIVTHGGISIGYFASDSRAYNEQTCAWYNPGTSSLEADHAVLIVGWDDAYPAGNFNTPPPAPGAWLVKNSWGSDWGDGGYFWLSYYDGSISGGTVFIPEEAGNYANNYGWDDLGWCGSIGSSSSNYMANVFTANGREVLKAVSFYTAAPDAQFEIQVYRGLGNLNNPTSGTLVSSQSGTKPLTGYHTIPLNQTVSLGAGSTFSVVVRMTTPGYAYPIAVECKVAGYSDKAVAHSRESFWSQDGSEWYDMAGDSDDQFNACIKAFTDLDDNQPDIPGDDPEPQPDDDPEPQPDDGRSVVSEAQRDWQSAAVANTDGAGFQVTFSSYIDVTGGGITSVSAKASGMSGVTAVVDGIKRADSPKDKTYHTLTITGNAVIPGNASISGIVFTQMDNTYRQIFKSPIVFSSPGTSGGGGGGGCGTLPIGGAVLACSVIVTLTVQKRKY